MGVIPIVPGAVVKDGLLTIALLDKELEVMAKKTEEQTKRREGWWSQLRPVLNHRNIFIGGILKEEVLDVVEDIYNEGTLYEAAIPERPGL